MGVGRNCARLWLPRWPIWPRCLCQFGTWAVARLCRFIPVLFFTLCASWRGGFCDVGRSLTVSVDAFSLSARLAVPFLFFLVLVQHGIYDAYLYTWVKSSLDFLWL